MTATRAWIIYTITRLGSFVVPFVVIMLILPDWEWNWVVGIVAGVLVSASISQIFLAKPRAVMAEQLAARRAKDGDQRTAADVEEDALLDEYEAARDEPNETAESAESIASAESTEAESTVTADHLDTSDDAEPSDQAR
ncbi:DUF4229 domain-containing protein [uncultured Gulosibacter sp.]|uniref:DUF4229 domain-containing protein n=1 Tax=uncultured Gulosibacter sp. TaxID=1339167 RepID=UPI00288B2FCF|nr:DUF4229 domain-containing protein [uncultured Gulosibacter sp.]